MDRRRRPCLELFLPLLLSPPANAYEEVWSPEGPFEGDYCVNTIDVSRAAWADVIVLGTLANKRAERWSPVTPHSYCTRFTLVTERILKGALQDSIEIVAEGGMIEKNGTWEGGGTAEMHMSNLESGDRVLVYLIHYPELGLFGVHQYYKFDSGMMTDCKVPMGDPLAPTRPYRRPSESRVIELAEEYVHCSSVIGLLTRSDLVIIGTMESETALELRHSMIHLRTRQTIKGPAMNGADVQVFRGGDHVDWKIGDHVLAFLQRKVDHYELCQGMAGHFTVVGDSAIAYDGRRVLRLSDVPILRSPTRGQEH